MIILFCELMDNGKGNKAIPHDVVYYIPNIEICTNGTLIHDGDIVEISNTDVVVFSANEDGMHFVKAINSTIPKLSKKMMDIRKAIKTRHDVTMYNDPVHFEDIGNKLSTYNLLKQLPYVPRYAEYAKDMKWNIFPCVVSASRASGGRFRNLCNNAEELHAHGRRIQKIKGSTFVVEYIDSTIESFRCFHNFRLMVVDDVVVDWFCRPGNDWNIHTRTQNKDLIQDVDGWCEEWMESHADLVKKLVDDMYGILGRGAYSYDLIIREDMIYLCEVGYKFWDDTVAKLIDIDKLTKDLPAYREKLKECLLR
jgi:hypothetical protein